MWQEAAGNWSYNLCNEPIWLHVWALIRRHKNVHADETLLHLSRSLWWTRMSEKKTSLIHMKMITEHEMTPFDDTGEGGGS